MGSKILLFYFLAMSKNVPPVNDNEQGPSGGALREIDYIFIERKDDIFLSCKQTFYC